MISIASVTVWFNPQNMDTPTASQAVTSYSSRMGKIYIVDNSDSDNHELAEKIPNSVYIPNTLMKPTDFNGAIRNLLVRKAESLYGKYCNLVPTYVKTKESSE